MTADSVLAQFRAKALRFVSFCQETGMTTYMRNPVKIAIAAGIASMLLQPVFAGVADDVKSAMQLLESKAMALGPATIEGEGDVAGKMVPELYFGDEKMNNNFALVDEV